MLLIQPSEELGNGHCSSDEQLSSDGKSGPSADSSKVSLGLTLPLSKVLVRAGKSEL